MLIAQGANDARGKQTESDQSVHAMQRLGIPVIYLFFPDEGHGWFCRRENDTAYHAVAEVFLAKWLGGRIEPIRSDLDGSSLTVPVGTEHVQGLTGALLTRQTNGPNRITFAVISTYGAGRGCRNRGW